MKNTKDEITQTERLQLLGLLTLGIKYQKMVTDIEKAMANITGAEVGSQLSDAVYDGNDDIDQILNWMGIGVPDATSELHD